MNVVLRGGTIIDGTGGKPYAGDVHLRGDRIAAIGQVGEVPGARDVDVRGLTVTPGLIDCHTHAEINLMCNRQQPASLYQGVSTLVVGQCGLGFAPMREEQRIPSERMNSGIFGHFPPHIQPFHTFSQYLSLLGDCAVNVASQVPHNAIRQWSNGFASTRLTQDQLSMSCTALEEALRAGARGMSVGLSYYPGGYADTEEIMALARVLKTYDALLSVHMRLDERDEQFDAMGEFARVALETGVRTHLLHHRTGGYEDYRTCMAPFEEAIARGVDVTFEFYPYLVGSGLMLAVIPDWAQEGGPDAILDRLRDAALRPRLMRDLVRRYHRFFPQGATGRLYLTRDPYSPDRGRTIDEIAEASGETVYDAVIRLLIENDLEVGFNGVEYQPEPLKEKLYDDQYRLFMQERYLVSSDSIPSNGLSHPRSSGTFARVIAHMRERGVPSETVIHKLTGMPARVYRLKDRGALRAGAMADVCIMDYDRVRDGADMDFGRRPPSGIRALYVNGLPALLEGAITGEFGGRALGV